MKFVESFGQFLITQWIWAVTFAPAMPIIAMLILLCLFLFYAKMRIVPSVLYAFFSELFAITAFTLVVHGIISWFLGIAFVSEEQVFLIHPLATTFLLAMIYTALQGLFFYLLTFFYRLPVKKYTALACVSNLIAMFIVYKFMPPL